MGNRNRSNVLLVEILIAIFFFMVSATVVVQVFVTAHGMVNRSAVETTALSEAQNVADALYAADAPEEALKAMDFASAHGVWTRSYGDFTLYVESNEDAKDAGTLWQGAVRAFYSLRRADQARQEDEELFSLPCARYKEGSL